MINHILNLQIIQCSSKCSIFIIHKSKSQVKKFQKTQNSKIDKFKQKSIKIEDFINFYLKFSYNSLNIFFQAKQSIAGFDKMSLYTNRYGISTFTGFNKDTSCKFTGNKNNKCKDVSQFFLDKKTIVKKLQKLMLEVKDLETKMFISKTISFVDRSQFRQGSCKAIKLKNQNANQEKNLVLDSNEKQNQLRQHPIFLNSVSDIKIGSNSMANSTIISGFNNESIFSVQNQSKFLNQTAASKGFFQTAKNTAQKNEIIEQTISQVGTVQCQCGLFESLLEMVEKLMDCELLKRREQAQCQFLEIDGDFIQQITEQLKQKFNFVQSKFKSLEQTINKEVVEKQSQNMKLSQKIKQLNKQVQVLQSKQRLCLQNHQNLLKQNYILKQQKIQLSSKLAISLRQIEQLTIKKYMLQENKGYEINALKFQLELKDNEITNLNTIVESLKKKTRQYKDEIKSMKHIQEVNKEKQQIQETHSDEKVKDKENKRNIGDSQNQNKKQQRIIVCYKLQIPEYCCAQTVINSSNCNSSKQSKDQEMRQVVEAKQNHRKLQISQLNRIKLQNEQLRDECLLLYEKINKIELFN